jgi:hypothetical protein
MLPALIALVIFLIESPLVPRADLGRQSSYLCLPHYWDYSMWATTPSLGWTFETKRKMFP